MAQALRTEKIDALLDKIKQVMTGEARLRMFEYIGQRLAVKGEAIARWYPDRREGVPLPAIYRTSKGLPTKFKSLKQQGFVFSLIKKGKIPRTRTGYLGNSFTSKVAVTEDGCVVETGSKLNYAPYVKGGQSQQNKYLAFLGWTSLEDDFKRAVPEFQSQLEEDTESYLKGYMR